MLAMLVDPERCMEEENSFYVVAAVAAADAARRNGRTGIWAPR